MAAHRQVDLVLSALALAILCVAATAEAREELGFEQQSDTSTADTLLNVVLGINAPCDDDPHKPLLPLGYHDLAVLLVAASTLFLAAGAGIGGGGVLLPLYMFAGGFSTRRAVALCNVTVAGGALANFLCNVRRRQAGSNRPIIDWELVLNMEPATIVGAVLGGYLNAVVPVWSTTVLLAMLLLYITVKLIDRAVRTYKAESAAMGANPPRKQSAAEKGNTGDGLGELLIADGPTVDASCDVDSFDGNGVEGPDGADAEAPLLARTASDEVLVQELRRDEQDALPATTVLALIFMAAWVVASDMLKLRLPCGSLPYWAAVLSLMPCAAAVMLIGRRRLLRKTQQKAELGWERREGDIHWDGRTTLMYPAFCSIAGVVAGLFGVGGGIIKGPLLLELGVLPEVAAATSATMILLTAGSASVVHISFGFVMPDYGLALVLMGFVTTLAGQLITYGLIKRLQRRSLIIFLMAGLLAVSAVLMWIRAGGAVERLISHPEELFTFGSVCRQ